ncbi:MAG: ABC transporter substrate-binding protein [Bacteroidota bacterium]
MKQLTLALDWTPNTNHTGFFVAQSKGYYQQHGLQLRITTPADDNYAITPAKKVELGEADFALCPMESVISYQTKSDPFPMLAIASLLTEDLSAIVALAQSGINRPADLDGKVYASYKARYEDEIVKAMIINDGGKGDLILDYPEKLGIWNTLLEGKADATWIFMNWEGVLAESKGVQLIDLRMKDFDIPYSYSPVLVADGSKIAQNEEAYSAFLVAAGQGYSFARQNPKEAADMLQPFVPDTDQHIDLYKSQELTSPYYLKEKWGYFEPARVDDFVTWLQQRGLENAQVKADDLYTNNLLS